MELISRDEAIKTARLMIGLTADERENEIRAIPIVEERKEGEWIDTDYINLRLDTYLASCSECGYQMNVRNNGRYFKYCPYCGARMKEASDE